jgi:hypothetical protein
LTRNVSRRLEQIEERAAVASARKSFCCRIHLVDPEKGLTGILVLEPGKPTMHVAPTPEEIEEVRTDLERRRGGRK